MLVLTDGEPSDIDVPDPLDLVEDSRRAVLGLRARASIRSRCCWAPRGRRTRRACSAGPVTRRYAAWRICPPGCRTCIFGFRAADREYRSKELGPCIEGRAYASTRLSCRAACQTSPAARAFKQAMPNPTIKSGHAECQRWAVASPAETIAIFAATSLRAPTEMLPWSSSPVVTVSSQHKGAGQIDGERPCPGQCQQRSVGSDRQGQFSPRRPQRRDSRNERIPASAIPTHPRLRAVQPTAIITRKLTDASSRKSILSANSDTDPMTRAAGQLDPKISEVEERNEPDNPLQCLM